jgi:hypothetical protein
VNTETVPAPRTKLNIDVKYRRSYARDDDKAILKNISLTGAFLRHLGEQMRSGDKIHVRFSVAGRDREVLAVVVWTNEFGCGVRFQPHNNRDIQIVDDLIYFVEEKQTDTRDTLDKIFKKVA